MLLPGEASMSAPRTSRRALPYRWELLVWLWLAFFFNQADRQVFSTVLPPLKADLALTDVQAGLIATLFTAVLAVMVPIAGYVGDVCNRTRVVTLSLLGWSIATLASGLASGFWFLLLVRSVATGAGEAFYAPAANALIAEHHDDTRGRAMAIHQTSLYLGVIASGLIAGLVAERYGWRSSFWLFGAAGIVLAALMGFRLKTQSAVAVRTPAPNIEAVSGVLRRPTVLLLASAWACMVFVNIGYMTWMPTFLHEQFALSLGNAGFSSMFYHHIGAFAGVALGGTFADRWAQSNFRARSLLQGLALLAGAPFIWLMGAVGNKKSIHAGNR
jgi:MFS family permease